MTAIEICLLTITSMLLVHSISLLASTINLKKKSKKTVTKSIAYTDINLTETKDLIKELRARSSSLAVFRLSKGSVYDKELTLVCDCDKKEFTFLANVIAQTIRQQAANLEDDLQ